MAAVSFGESAGVRMALAIEPMPYNKSVDTKCRAITLPHIGSTRIM